MKTSIPALLASTALAWAPALARPSDDTVVAEPQSPESEALEMAQAPASPEPRETPPPPPAKPPAPPKESAAPPGGQGKAQGPSGSAQTPPGQWVYTPEYGWVWMPQGEAYHYQGAGGSYAYVYYPAVGWTWLVAPWAWGWWPWPYYGFAGYWPWGYRWYGPGWRGYYGWWGRGWPGHGWGGTPRATPAPPRRAPPPRGRH